MPHSGVITVAKPTIFPPAAPAAAMAARRHSIRGAKSPAQRNLASCRGAADIIGKRSWRRDCDVIWRKPGALPRDHRGEGRLEAAREP